MKVIKYKAEYFEIWDSFIDESKNGSFLFKRNFLEYHSDRFEDYSLMVMDNQKPIAILPANIKDNIVYSHQGLTYGGVILHNKIRLLETIEISRSVLEFLNNNGVNYLFIKTIPRIYHTMPADELEWIIFKLNGKLYRRDTSLAIDNYAKKISYQERRKRAIKKAAKFPIQIKKGFHEIKPFWNEVLIPNLMAKHGVAPVHSLDEIQLLAGRFPENIIQHTLYLNGTAVAGCTMFLNKTVAHAQYISGTEIGRNTGCLDYLFDYLISKEYVNHRYFDFGICNEQDGHKINKGLLEWKEGFGARTIVHDFYEIDTKSYSLLDDILI